MRACFRRIALISTATTLMMGAAAAADLSTRKPSPAPVYAATTWGGFYVGAHLGWAQHNGNMDAFTPWNGFAGFPVTGLRSSGMIGGLQAGYNYQMGQIVLGLEADASLGNLNKGSDLNGPGTFFWSKSTWSGTIAPRLGYSFGDALLYVKGGLAIADFEYRHLQGAAVISGSNTRAGYVLGAGLEYALNRNLSLKAEYNYMNFGSGRTTLVGAPTIWVEPNREIHAVKLGLNYRFGGSAPVVAKY